MIGRHHEVGSLVFFRPRSEREIRASLRTKFGVTADEVEAEVNEPLDLNELLQTLANEGVVEDDEFEVIAERIRRLGTPS